jgi:transposase
MRWWIPWGHLMAVSVTPANEQDRAQVGELAKAVQAVVEDPVQIAFVDQGYTGEQPAAEAAQQGIKLEVIKHHEAKRGFVLLPRRWVVAPLPGRRVFAGWPAIMNGSPQHWLATIGWPLSH